MCAYFYESGFCQQFGIPVDLIEISWDRFLAATIKLVYLILAVYLVFLVGIPFYMKKFEGRCKILKAGVIKVISFLLMVVLLYCFSYFMPLHITGVGDYYMWSVLLLTVLLIVIFKSYGKNLKDQPKSKPLQKGGAFILLLVLLLSLPLVYSDRGSKDALQVEEYSVLSSNESIVVLRIYGDNAICVPWYREGNQSYITKEFVILPLENMALIPQQIGPLHVKSAE